MSQNYINDRFAKLADAVAEISSSDPAVQKSISAESKRSMKIDVTSLNRLAGEAKVYCNDAGPLICTWFKNRDSHFFNHHLNYTDATEERRLDEILDNKSLSPHERKMQLSDYFTKLALRDVTERNFQMAHDTGMSVSQNSGINR